LAPPAMISPGTITSQRREAGALKADLDRHGRAITIRNHRRGNDPLRPANYKILQSAVKLLAFEHVGRNHAGNSKGMCPASLFLLRKSACRVGASRRNEEEVKSLRE